MKRKIIYISVPLLIVVAAVVWLCTTYPATLRNVYEDSWWIETPNRSTYTAWPKFDAKMERIYAMEQMAEQRAWRELLPYARSVMNENRTNSDNLSLELTMVAMRYAMLAESCLGTLPYNILLYPLQSPEDFVLFRNRGREACMFNMFFFRELGLPDEAFHQAMEYPQGFVHCTHRALRMMTESAWNSGDTAVAGKLQNIRAQSALCRLLDDDVCKGEPGRNKVNDARSDIFIFGDPMVNVFVRMLSEDSDNRRLVDYAAISFLLMGRKDKCQQLLRMCPVYEGQTLPPVYQ